LLQLKNDQELNLIRITFGISFMDKILIVGANGSVGKSCVNNLKENNDLVLISRSEFDSDIEGNFEKNLLDINNYSETVNFINNIDYEISGIVFAIGSIDLKPFSSTSLEDFKKIMDENFYNIVHFLNNCINKMSDSSSVVFFSSIAAVRGFKNHTAISSAKSALIGLSNSLAADYAPKIRFNTISPSLSISKMSNFMISNEKIAEGIGKLHPMSRLGTGDDIGNLASFLVSKKASWITGQNFQLDGGRSTLITK
tara:strand:+ start:669 stop:1433 length:765 start_codon:yes stop_codon:yes gene_type:complete